MKEQFAEKYDPQFLKMIGKMLSWLAMKRPTFKMLHYKFIQEEE